MRASVLNILLVTYERDLKSELLGIPSMKKLKREALLSFFCERPKASLLVTGVTNTH